MTTLRRFNIDWDCETIVDNEMGQYCYAQEALEIFNRLQLNAERSGVCETCIEESVKVADQLRADVERLKKAVVQAAVDEGRRVATACDEMVRTAERKAAEWKDLAEKIESERAVARVECASRINIAEEAERERDEVQRECTVWREQAEYAESARDGALKECASWRDIAEEAERERDEVQKEWDALRKENIKVLADFNEVVRLLREVVTWAESWLPDRLHKERDVLKCARTFVNTYDEKETLRSQLMEEVGR